MSTALEPRREQSLWKRLFGESHKDAWTRLAHDIGGELREAKWLTGHAVHARLGGYDIVLDTYTVSTGKTTQTFTRMRAPFANSTGLRFGVHRASIFTGIAKALGKQDLEIGVADFDKDFVIQGNDVERVRAVLADPALRAMIAAQPYIQLSVVDDEGLWGTKFGPAVDTLTFVQGGVVKDVERLKGLFSLFAALLAALQRGGHPLDVPGADVPRAFADLLDDVVGALGATLERSGDALVAHIEDPLGVAQREGPDAVLTVALPALPLLTTSIHLDAALPQGGAALTVKPRGLFAGGTRTGDATVDDALAVEAPPELAARLVRPLARLAACAPVVEAGDDALTARIEGMAAHDALHAVGALLDLWQELVRARAGL